MPGSPLTNKILALQQDALTAGRVQKGHRRPGQRRRWPSGPVWRKVKELLACRRHPRGLAARSAWAVDQGFDCCGSDWLGKKGLACKSLHESIDTHHAERQADLPYLCGPGRIRAAINPGAHAGGSERGEGPRAAGRTSQRRSVQTNDSGPLSSIRRNSSTVKEILRDDGDLQADPVRLSARSAELNTIAGDYARRICDPLSSHDWTSVLMCNSAN